VLLTRSPLVYPRRGLTVRLACVKHAASVRPEPGSNSPLKNISNTTTQKRLRQSCQKQRVQPLTEPKTGSIINQSQRNPTQPDHNPKGCNQARHEVSIVHISALTLSTLLSSQDSLTHRTRLSHPAWGNSINISPSSWPSQIGLSGEPPLTCSAPRPSGEGHAAGAVGGAPGPATRSSDRRPAPLRASPTLHL
jgi:hypothetical protein